MGGNAFSHGHFSRGRNVKGNGHRESRRFERNDKAKAKRHSFWRCNVERKLQRDMRAVQCRMEETNPVRAAMKEMGKLYDACHDDIVQREGDAVDATFSNKNLAVSNWVADQAEIIYENGIAGLEEQTNRELFQPTTPAMTWTDFSDPASALYTPPITQAQFRESTLMIIPADDYQTLGADFSRDFIMFDDGTGSEIDFENMSNADPTAFPPLD